MGLAEEDKVDGILVWQRNWCSSHAASWDRFELLARYFSLPFPHKGSAGMVV